MPPDNLHMTTLEITHSLTEPEIEARVDLLSDKLEEITDFTFDHRARLVNPMVSYDASAVALSFVPAASREDEYTYHHLRRDLYTLCSSTGVKVDSRYVVPSAHLTIGRFLDNRDLSNDGTDQGALDSGKIREFVAKIEEINKFLEDKYWGISNNNGSDGEWIVGQEKGLDCCKGTLWYGNGNRVHLGKGF
jgi:hypothetical protein